MIKKVIHFITSLKRGGRERQLCTIFSHNDPDFQDIRIMFLYNSDDSYIEEFNIPKDKLIHIRSKDRLSRMKEIAKVLRRERPDAVYSWGAPESFFALMLKPFFSYRFINGSIRHGIVSGSLAQYWRMLLLHLSGNIVANSRAGLKANHLGRGYVLYNGIDPKFLATINPEKKFSEMRNTLNHPVLISVANLVPYKDYFTVLKALAAIRDKGIRFSYLIIGEGPERKAIEESISRYRLHEEVTLLGSTSEVAQYLAISDIFIHSSKGEGCSNAILEAMAAGLPVIATDTGGTSEVVNSSTGRLFPYQDQEQLIIRLEELIASDSVMKSLGVQSRNEIIERFSIERMMKDYYQIIEKICPA